MLRHAKSDYPPGVKDDHQRPLNRRGEDACKIMGDYIKQQSIVPGVVLCSDAVRTSQTINNILSVTGYKITVQFLRRLYLATPGEILREVAKVSDDVNSAMVVCHNPGVSQITSLLMRSGDDDSIMRLQKKYATAGLACFTLQIEKWSEIGPECGHLDCFVTPKLLVKE